MNKHKLIFLFLLLAGISDIKAQGCDCPQAFKFVSSWIEKNSPSYDDQVVKSHQETNYSKFKAEMSLLSQNIGNDSFSCINLIAQYFHYFRDEHLQLNYKSSFFNFNDEDSNATIAFYQKFPYNNSNNLIRKSNPYLGYWQNKDGSLVFEVVPDKNPLHDMVGRIIVGDSLYWHKNQVRLEIRKNRDKYIGILWAFTRQPRAYDLHIIGDSILKIGNGIIYYRANNISDFKQIKITEELEEVFSFRKLSDSTCYLRIPSFYDAKEKVDSLLQKNINALTSTPNLIIDIRNNGGGSDNSYYPLFPFIFTKKEIEEPYSLSTYATLENYDANKNQIYLYAHNKQDSLKFDKFIDKLKANLGHYTHEEFGIHKIDTIFNQPTKIAVLDNSQCGSSAEGFVMYAKESPKVTIYGEDTWGEFSYGNIRYHDVPGLPILIGIPTGKAMFRYKYLENRESLGIKPDIYLNSYKPSEWIDIVKKKLENK